MFKINYDKSLKKMIKMLWNCKASAYNCYSLFAIVELHRFIYLILLLTKSIQDIGKMFFVFAGVYKEFGVNCQ